MSLQKRWSRRVFVQSAACITATAAASPHTLLQQKTLPPDSNASSLAFVGSAENACELHVFSVHHHQWAPQQRIESRSPASLVLHPHLPSLYVVNQIDEVAGRPRGSVEAYAINPRTKRINLINHRPLSLSAIRPRHLAIMPDGSAAVVAVHGGGSYNVLRIEPDGALGSVSGRLKETGSGPIPQLQSSSHPHSVAFDSTGRFLFSTDEGGDRLNVFQIDQGKITRRQWIHLEPGSGPGHLSLHESGSLLFIANGLNNSISGYRFNNSTGEIENQTASVMTKSADRNGSLMQIGNTLYCGGENGITVLRIDPSSGELTEIQNLPHVSVNGLVSSPDKQSVFGFETAQNRIIKLSLDQATREITGQVTVAELAKPISLAFKSR